MAKTKTKELQFIAEGKTSDGQTQNFSVYKMGGSFYITRTPGLYKHLCHPSVKDSEGVKREIALVFNAPVTSVKYPRELHAYGSKSTK